jgi:hypothetical protein
LLCRGSRVACTSANRRLMEGHASACPDARKRVPPNEAGVSPALTPLCHRLVCHASGGKHAQVDRPLRRARLIIMRLSPPCVGIEVRAGPARLLDPPAAILRLNNRAKPPVRWKTRSFGIGQKKRSPGRPRVRRIIESVRWGA